MKAKIVVAARPGRDSGRTILEKTFMRLAPSIMAASSMEGEMESKYPFIIQVQKGTVKVV